MEKNDKAKKQSASNKVEPTDLKKPDEFDNGKSDSSSEEIDALPPIDDVSLFFVLLSFVEVFWRLTAIGAYVLLNSTNECVKPLNLWCLN